MSGLGEISPLLDLVVTLCRLVSSIWGVYSNGPQLYQSVRNVVKGNDKENDDEEAKQKDNGRQ